MRIVRRTGSASSASKIGYRRRQVRRAEVARVGHGGSTWVATGVELFAIPVSTRRTYGQSATDAPDPRVRFFLQSYPVSVSTLGSLWRSVFIIASNGCARLYGPSGVAEGEQKTRLQGSTKKNTGRVVSECRTRLFWNRTSASRLSRRSTPSIVVAFAWTAVLVTLVVIRPMLGCWARNSTRWRRSRLCDQCEFALARVETGRRHCRCRGNSYWALVDRGRSVVGCATATFLVRIGFAIGIGRLARGMVSGWGECIMMPR